MSIGLIVTRGFGNGTFSGNIGKIVTRGYDISSFIPPVVPVSRGLVGSGSTGIGLTGNQSTGNGITGRGSL